MTNRAPVPHANVLGVKVSAIHLHQATRLLLDAIAANERGYVTVTGVHGVMEAQKNSELLHIFNSAWLVTPDGMPMTWVGRLQGYRHMARVYGPDLMSQIMASTRDGKIRHFLYGGKEGVADRLKLALERRFPGVCICGTYTPPFRPLNRDEISQLTLLVSELRPHILWVGLSTPKQEWFMSEMNEKLDVNFMIGVGAAFDMHSGLLSQAPLWMQGAGLEWLFRLCQEPTRLWRRYLINNPVFLVKVLRQFMQI